MELLLTMLGLAKYFVIGASILMLLEQNHMLPSKISAAFVVFFAFLYGIIATSILLHIGLATNLLPLMHVLTWALALVGLIQLATKYRNSTHLLLQGDWRARSAFILGYTWQVILLTFQPVMANDARAIWLLKAKALFSGTIPFFTYLQNKTFAYSHQDYPITIPLLYTDIIRPMGHFWEPASGILSWTFFAVLIIGLYGAIRQFTRLNKTLALLLTCAIFFTPEYMRQGWAGLADVPLSLFFFGSVLGLQFISDRSRIQEYIIPISTAILGATVKNEGQSFLLFTILLCAWLYSTTIIKAKTIARTDIVKQILSVGTLMLVTLLPLAIWKIITWQYAIANDVTSALNFHLVVSRIPVLFSEILPRVFDGYRFGILLVPAMLLLSLPRNQQVYPLGTVLVLTQALTYLAVYLFTPYDLAWHISTSFSRLVLHLLPVLFLLTLVRFSNQESSNCLIGHAKINHA